MSSKIQKKIKSKRSMIELENKEVLFSDEPQNILGILNYGLLNGIKTDVIIEKVNEFVKLADLILPPNKSYCFLEFLSIDDAQQVLQKLNGVKLLEEGFPLLLSYCKTIPRYQQNINKDPEGLILLLDFITDEMEQQFLSLLEWDENKLKNRQVLHFGYEFIYGQNTIDSNSPLDRKIPKLCDELWNMLGEQCPEFKGFVPDQLTVNKYEPGNGIPSHVDTHSIFEEPIISLSLGASIIMEFKDTIAKKHIKKLLPSKSLLIMSGESRYCWTHGITPKTSDVVKTNQGFLTVQKRRVRYSFTFRKLKIPPFCACNFTWLCDMQSGQKKEQSIAENLEVNKKIAAKLEMENVHNIYDKIGSHFSETRHSPWPNVANFILSLKPGSVLLDVGCGNGKYLNINDDITKLGCDRSETLLNVCRQRNFQVFQCDCLQLPVPDDSIDACISIAVIHHLATPERRIKSIKEILRVLKEDGLALIYVWAKDQQKDNKKTSYLLQHQSKANENTKKLPEMATLSIDEEKIELPIHRNRTQFGYTNLLVPWKLKQKEVPEEQQKVYLRYYHVFEDGELDSLCRECGNINVEKSFYDQGNHCVILKKLSNFADTELQK